MNRVIQLLILAACIGGIMTPAVAAAQVEVPGDIFVLDFTLSRNGSVNVSGVSIEEGQPTNFGAHDAHEPNYQLTMEAKNGTDLFRQGLKIDFKVYPYQRDPYFIDKREFYWRLPYHNDAHRIELRDLDRTETVLVINLTERFCTFDQQCSAFCTGKGVDVDCTCGNGMCDSVEDAERCQEDCGEQSSEDSSDINGTGEDTGSGGVNGVVMGMIAVIVVLIGGLVLYAWREVEVE